MPHALRANPVRRGPHIRAKVGWTERLPSTVGWAVGPIDWTKKPFARWADAVQEMLLTGRVMVFALPDRDYARRKSVRATVVDAAHNRLVGIHSVWDRENNTLLFEEHGGYRPPDYGRYGLAKPRLKASVARATRLAEQASPAPEGLLP
jgi:hypothetical protein